jgi:uncharacterized protein YuzE
VWTYDGDAKASYYKRTDNPIVKTVEGIPGQFIDLDADGEVVGVEVLDSQVVTA